MSHRFVRCPHCKLPHDAAERVCPHTGLHMPVEARSPSREGRSAELGGVGARRGSSSSESRRAPTGGGLSVGGRRDDRPEAPSVLRSDGDHPHPLIGQTVGGRYRVRGVLGEGGMGTVYDAEHIGLSRQVAIKVLSPMQAKKRVSVKRFQQEARAAGAIGHPNICEVYDLGLLDDGSPYLVMEKLVGQTLADRIGKEGGLPFDEVVEVIVQVLSGLAAAHDKGIVHRDIKPENIFLARRVGCPPIIKILDFGVSKMMPEFLNGEEQLDLTRTGMVMGTPYYMSPEQARGERNLDGRVDVYACGVVMYEAIAGRRPFLAPNYNALLLAIINTLPRPLRELRAKTPPELEAIIMRAMARNRADRYATASQFLRDLNPGVAPPAAEGSGRLPLPPTPEERKRAPVVGGGRMPDGRTGDPRGRRETSSATLRARMAEGERDARGWVEPRRDPHASAARPSLDEPTMIEGRARSSSPKLGHDNEDVDIPIHVTIDDEPEDPTAIFRPGMHPSPGLALRTHAAGPRRNTSGSLVDPRSDGSPADRYPVGRRPGASPNDWDRETVVKHPDLPPHIAEQDSRLRRDPRPFNPEETIRVDRSADLERADVRKPPRRR